VTTLWIIYEFLVVFWTQKRPKPQWWEWTIIALSTVAVAGYGYRTDHQDRMEIQNLNGKQEQSIADIGHLGQKIEDLRRDNETSRSQLVAMIESMLADTPEGLKKQALQLSDGLYKFAQDNSHVNQRAGRGEYERAFMPTLEPAEKAKRIRAWQDALQKKMEQQTRDDEAAKAAYPKQFADRVATLRAELITNGQTKWSHNASFYQSPQSIRDVQTIAFELATNAQALR
jgi:hypothetical protein